MAEIVFKTGDDGTNAEIDAEICDGAGRCQKVLVFQIFFDKKLSHIFLKKVHAARLIRWIIVATMTSKKDKLIFSPDKISWQVVQR